MHMGIEAPGERKLITEFFPSIARKPGSTKVKSGIQEFYVWPFSEGIVYDSLVLVDGDGTCRIDNYARCSGRVRRNTVDGAEDKLLL